MEGKNILYGGVEDLEHIHGLVEARENTRAEISKLYEERERLEKDVAAEEKLLHENIDCTIKKRRNQVVANFDKELRKSQDRLKRVRNERTKEKNKKIQKRIKEETKELVIENKNIHEEIRTYFKQKGISKGFDNGIVYTLYFPRTTGEIATLVLTLFMGVFVIPTVLMMLIGGKWFVRVLLEILFIGIFVGLYSLGYRYFRIKYKNEFLEIRTKRSAIVKNISKINRIKRSIKKDNDEDQYGLSGYDESIQELEGTINDIVQKKNQALTEFEKNTTVDIKEEIKDRDMPKINGIHSRINEIGLKLSELEQRQKDMTLNLMTNYGAYLGEENLTIERIESMILLVQDGEAVNIGDAVNKIKDYKFTTK